MKIPEKINRFRAYVGTVTSANQLVGITAETTLPTFEMMSETLSLAGTNGEIDSPSPGQFKSATIEIGFSNISREMFELVADDSKALILRGPQETLDQATQGKGFVQRAVTCKGMTKSINYGKLKKGGYGEPSITKEVLYYKDEYDGTVVTEIDKLNDKWVVNGKNMMADIEEML